MQTTIIKTQPITQDGKLHISQVKRKTVEVLANCNLVNDWYHNNIKKTSQIILDNPIAGNSWEYVTQYTSGNCVYKLFDKTLSVNPETGKIN